MSYSCWICGSCQALSALLNSKKKEKKKRGQRKAIKDAFLLLFENCSTLHISLVYDVICTWHY